MMSRKPAKPRDRRRLLLQGFIILLIIAVLLTNIHEQPSEPQISEIQPPTHSPTSAPTDSPTSTPTHSPTPPPEDTDIRTVALEAGRGFIGDWWQVYFNEPSGDSDPSGYVGGIDVPLADAIAEVKETLDIAAFEMNNELIYQSILAAHRRGVRVRIVTDDEHGLEDKKDAALRNLKKAGIAVVDDSRSALMHNKFMIMDSKTVWTGSWNYTVNGTYRNSNNVFVMENATAAAAYQAEFDEMFDRSEFGARSTDDGTITFSENGTEISIIFASEADEIPELVAEIQKAEHSIHFMVFVFSLDELADAILEMMAHLDIRVQGIFEKRNSTASWSQLPALHCAGVQVRQDGNRYILHHKVFIIDEETVITGSFNYSNNAAKSHDENIVVIRDPDIASRYMDEWQGLWDSAENLRPGKVECD